MLHRYIVFHSHLTRFGAPAFALAEQVYQNAGLFAVWKDFCALPAHFSLWGFESVPIVASVYLERVHAVGSGSHQTFLGLLSLDLVFCGWCLAEMCSPIAQIPVTLF